MSASAREERREEVSALFALQHQVRNHLGLLSALARFLADESETPEELARQLTAKMQAVGLIYEELAQVEAAGSVRLRSYLTGLAGYLEPLAPPGVSLDFRGGEGDPEMGASAATQLGILLTDLVLSIYAAALGEADKIVTMHLDIGERKHRLIVEGPCSQGPDTWPSGAGTYARALGDMLDKLGCELEISQQDDVRTVTLALPWPKT